MVVMPRCCPQFGASVGEPHLQSCPHAKHALSRQLLVHGSGKGVVQ
jgi:hypothetical protein